MGKLKQSGFGIIEIILILALAGAVALTVWKIDQADKEPAAGEDSVIVEENGQTEPQAEDEGPGNPVEPDDQPLTVEDSGFTLIFPAGWTLKSDTGTAGVESGRSVVYSKNSQTVELVIGNQLGKGVAADTTWFFELDSTGRDAQLISSPSDICTDRFSGFCSGGNDQLEIFVKLSDTAEAVPANGHAHIFFITDTSTENADKQKLDEYRSIINSLVINI